MKYIHHGYEDPIYRRLVDRGCLVYKKFENPLGVDYRKQSDLMLSIHIHFCALHIYHHIHSCATSVNKYILNLSDEVAEQLEVPVQSLSWLP